MHALLWQPRNAGKVHCMLCQHNCLLATGQTGHCGVRQNVDGELQSLVGYTVAAVNLDPIEKKPLYHYLPGTTAFSVGTVGCNLTCDFCQNHTISQLPAQQKIIRGERTTPELLVQQAKAIGASAIAYTYTEPTVFFELVHDTSQIACSQGLANVLVSNGFQSRDCLYALKDSIHAANIDIKSFRDAFYRTHCGARLAPVLTTVKTIRALGWWLEVTTLLIPGCNDSEQELRELARFIVQELGADTPWHISRFHGAYHMAKHPVTPANTMERAWTIAQEEGLHYPYIGNMPTREGGTTYCPQCHAPCVVRYGFQSHSLLVAGACPQCHTPIAGCWSKTCC